MASYDPTANGAGEVVVLVARYEVRDGSVDVVAAALDEMARAVAREEPGCLVYDINQDREDPLRFLLYEVYRDQAALDFHRGTPHFRDIVEGRVAPFLQDRSRAFYARVSSASKSR